MTKELLLKFIENKAAPHEKEEVISWIEKSPENQKKYNFLKAQYVADNLKNVKEEQYQSVVKAIQSRRKRKLATSYSIAACVTMLLGFSLFYITKNKSFTQLPHISKSYLSEETVEILTKKDSLQEIKLPDGSTVSLNGNSQIIYPKTFSGNVRMVTLKGEAYFDIVHNKKKPFIVQTKAFDIKVLGTTFNVKSYPEDKLSETTLLSGKVELSREEETTIVLEPSQKAIFNRDNEKIEIEKVNTESTLAWKSGKLIFNRTPLEQVVIDLERKYNTEIEIVSPELLNYEYTGTFDNLTLDEALKLLRISSQIQYETINQKIMLTMK
ncbi:MAG: FecR domain-containing protein [Flavobacteriaceae bacterium]